MQIEITITGKITLYVDDEQTEDTVRSAACDAVNYLTIESQIEDFMLEEHGIRVRAVAELKG